ncbi:MAG: pyridoxal phosphate-dependent aminotransferase [Thermotogaceae bacterium]|nr:pyridoxal phosphate-dependent aminotransferase [Thermotogaceae bacterium]
MMVFVNRKGTNSYKWDMKPERAPEDLISMWVADMDFKSPEPVIKALKERVEHGVFGYTFKDDEYFESLIHWMRSYHDIEIKREWIVPVPGVVFGIAASLRVFTEEGDGVIIQPPVYWPFFSTIRENKRKIIENELVYENGTYKMNFEDLENKVKDARAFILCSPHNPVGRVWNESELKTLIEVLKRNDVFLISDEIHADLIFKKFHSTVEFYEIYDKIVVLTSPSKTFNIPSLHIANALIPNEDLRKSFEDYVHALHLDMTNPLSMMAMVTAYKEGRKWLEETLKYIRRNMEIVVKWTESKDYVDAYFPEGTYLLWLDFRKTELDSDEIFEKLIKSGLWLQNGKNFGSAGNGFMRMNVATSEKIVKEALQRINKAFL